MDLIAELQFLQSTNYFGKKAVQKFQMQHLGFSLFIFGHPLVL
jgi:hypothetical protein